MREIRQDDSDRWRPLDLEGFNWYEISRDGEVRSTRARHGPRKYTTIDGVLTVALYRYENGRRIRLDANVDELVTKAFQEGED